jgi:hypothetical protein
VADPRRKWHKRDAERTQVTGEEAGQLLGSRLVCDDPTAE